MNDISRVCDLLERLSTMFRNSVRLEGLKNGLHPVHQEVLFYLSRCNQYSDTPAGVTEFLGITKGTASQSIRLLESKELLTKEQDENDGRVIHLKLTAKGKKIASVAIPPPVLKIALENFSEPDGNALEGQLELLLKEMQQTNNSATFGLCKTCVYHQLLSAGTFHCELTQEELPTKFGELICREHTPKAE